MPASPFHIPPSESHSAPHEKETDIVDCPSNRSAAGSGLLAMNLGSSRRVLPDVGALLAMNLGSSRRVLRYVSALLAFVAWAWLGYAYWRTATDKYKKTVELNDVPSPALVDKAVVLGKVRHEDVSWIHDLRPNWVPYIYTLDERPEPGYRLIPPSRQGREAMVYLTYIIDFYDSLPNVTAFVHPGREQWHNVELGPWTSTILENLRIETVRKRGYVNFRCKWDPGCPTDVNPLDPTEIDIESKNIRAYFADIYMELFDVTREQVPKSIGNICCGQFAVTRERIRARPREDYIRMRKWAMQQTVTTSFNVGWVFERVWHIIFGFDARYCPDPDTCRCELYGWCGVPKEGLKDLATDEKPGSAAATRLPPQKWNGKNDKREL